VLLAAQPVHRSRHIRIKIDARSHLPIFASLTQRAVYLALILDVVAEREPGLAS
jgi:hypothetical protein